MTPKNIETVKTDKSATIFLNRPEVRNAFNPPMISGLITAVKMLASDPEIRVLVIRGKNCAFSSGADLNWLKESGSKTFSQNSAENRIIRDLMETLHQVPVPLISVVEGPAFGGALGILGCSDWVLAEKNSRFAFSEVKLGLAPAIIMPYIIGRTGSLKIKQFMLTGEQFDAWEALDAGLADHIGDTTGIDAELKKLVQTFSNLPGGAVREIKKLWTACKPPVAGDIAEITIDSLAKLKQTPEAQSLLLKFLNKRK
jgi:methylglutaconyl-CoA hydratase